MSKLLINEHPLQVLPSLATKIGLNEALVLQQIHYWISDKSTFNYEDKKWVYNTYDEWKEQFPFFSISTIKRTLQNLKKENLLIGKKLSKNKFDKTNYYTIDYDALNELEKPSKPHFTDKVKLTRSNEISSEPIDWVNLTRCTGQIDPMGEVKVNQSYIVKSLTETTTETTTETSSNEEKKTDFEFIKFLKNIRKEYTPNPDKKLYPNLIQVKSSETNEIGNLRLDLNGHLYASFPNHMKNLDGVDASHYWNYLYRNQDKILPLPKIKQKTKITGEEK